MKKLLTSICTGLLLLGLAACGGDYPPPPETEQIPLHEARHRVEVEDTNPWLVVQGRRGARAVSD
ncbi:MAG: hypothetical protein F4X59_09355, partial [Holophagales bacterium]|nr:hypothetical protein [Holophagales bacterium]